MITSSTESTKLQQDCQQGLRAAGGFNLHYQGEEKQQMLASNAKMLGTLKNRVAEFNQRQG